MRELLEQGANAEAVDKDGNTALHLAAKNGHDAVIRTLLDKGANICFRRSDAVGEGDYFFFARHTPRSEIHGA